MGDVLILPEHGPGPIHTRAAGNRRQVGQHAVLTFDNRSPPRRIFRGDALMVCVGAPIGDVGALGQALLGGDFAAAKDAAMALDGHFAVLVISSDRIAAATDSAGSIPIYFHTANGRTVLGTRVNEVAEAVGAGPDTVSIYDFAIHACICHPYTWFSDVRVAQPASIIEVVEGRLTQTYYWTPAQSPRISLADAVPAFQQQMARSISVAAEEKVALLMSAGEDSRAVAAFLPPDRAVGYTFLNALNREWAFAELVAKALGLPLTPLIRDDPDLAAHVDDRQRCIGYGYDIMQGHVFPFVDRIAEGRVLGGWTSDTMFKGYYLRPRNGRFPERGPRGHFVGPASEEIKARYHARYDQIASLVPAPIYEWMRVWPICGHPHYPHYASARRYFDQREPYFHARMYRLAASISPEDKWSRQLFYRATNPQLGMAAWLPTSRGTVPALDGAESEHAKQMIAWHDEHLHPGVPQSAWGRSGRISASPSFPSIADAVEAALAAFDEGRFAAWVAQRAAELEARRNDPLLAPNRIIQIGLALSKRTQEITSDTSSSTATRAA